MIAGYVSRSSRAAVKAAAHLADRLRPPPRGVVILLYHRVGAGTASQVDLPTGLFADQMAELAATRRVVSLDAALEELALPAPPPDDPVVVTFDDGTADLVEHATPVLVEHGIPAVLYAATAWIDRNEPFWGEGPSLSWAALRDAHDTGVWTIGSHTHDHRLLDRDDPAAIATDLDRSIESIGDELGVAPTHFAYPKAIAPSKPARREVERRFRSATLAGTRPNPYGAADPYALARSPIQVADGLRWFRYKAAGGMGLEDRIRRQIDRRRYADAAQ